MSTRTRGPDHFDWLNWLSCTDQLMVLMRTTSLAFAPAILLAIFLHVISPCLSYTSFVFGDSLVDAGNNDYFFTLSKADSPPYGIDFLSSGGRPTGRFTNGRTVADIVGEELGQKAFLPPYLAPRSDVAVAVSGGVNYASGASGILDETGTSFIGRVPLSRQVRYFEQTVTYMVGLEGENSSREFLKEAVFSVTIGSNDILNYLAPSMPFFSEEKVEPDVLQDFMVSNLTRHLKRLHELGGRKFMVNGVGPLGCIPYVRALQLVSGESCSAVANRLVEGYNTKLRKTLEKLNHEFGPDSVFVYGNSYDIFTEILQNSQTYGFENTKDPCCGGSFPPFVCFKGPDAKTSPVLCEDRSKYVFWDAYHPTEAANVIVAGKLLDGDERSTYPINLRRLNAYRN